METWSPSSRLAKVVNEAGFVYDPGQDIIVSRPDAYQRHAGYNWLYDVASPTLHMIIDCEPFYFEYGGHAWLIELWKGQYGIEAGGEIGLYRDRSPLDQRRTLPRTRHYDCPPSDFGLPTMSFTLHLRGRDQPLMRRGPERHWWLTGFRWGQFAAHSHDLTMKLELTFQKDRMPFGARAEPGAGRGLREAFMASVKARGYGVAALGALGVGFTFDRPRSQQPASRMALESDMQRKNRELVGAYNLLRQSLGITNNDPNAFDQLDGPVNEAVQSLKDGAAKLQQTATSLAGQAAAKLPVGHKPGKLASGAGPAPATPAGKLEHAAGAAAGRLRGELPGGAGVAYDTLFRVYERKLWHVQTTARASQ